MQASETRELGLVGKVSLDYIFVLLRRSTRQRFHVNPLWSIISFYFAPCSPSAPSFISIILQHAFLVFFCAVCMLHVAQSEDEETDYEMNDSD